MKQFIILIIVVLLVKCQEKNIEEEHDEIHYVYKIFTEQCYEEIFTKSNYNYDCLSDSASRALSLMIVFFAFLNQLPQIYKIVKHKSTQGLAYNSIYNESFLISFNISYNLYKGTNFFLYGENVFVLIEFHIVMSLFLKYDENMTKLRYFKRLFIYLIVNLPLFLGYGPQTLYNGVMYINISLLFISRIPQIYMNCKNKSTGQMSLLTQLQNQSGAIARIFTLFVSSTDILYITLVSEDNILSTILTTQICCYYRQKIQQKSPSNYQTVEMSL